MKALAAEQWTLSDSKRAELAAAADALALRRLRGRDDYVVTPCHGFVHPKLEGTRLTVQDSPPEGVELSIRTALTPDRWAAYDPEMQAAWEHLCQLAATRTDDTDDTRRSALFDAVLRLTFFWYNFMPLTRGSAAVGWTMLMAMLLAHGYEVCEQAPEGLSLDWEAILEPSPQAFTAATRAWLEPICRPPATPVDALPSVAHTVHTYRHVLEALNAPEPPA